MNRKTISRKNKFFALVFLMLVVASLFAGLDFLAQSQTVLAQMAEQIQPAATSSCSAKAYCVMESQSGRVLYGGNLNQKLAMASTTKIMTAITAIENCKDLDAVFEVSPKAVGVPGTSIYLRKGERFSIRQLLYGLMLVSGNDASVAIGEQVGGNIDNFVAMMNSLAQKIGATNTHFDNTHGLDSKTHYTTALDLAKITSYAMQNPTFAQIVSTKSTKIVSGNGQERYLKNKNKLLNSLQGCDGVKTGFTDDAGRCLVSSCTRDGMQLVCVALNCGPMFEESKKLLEKGFAQFKLHDMAKLCRFERVLKVDDAKQGCVKLQVQGSAYYPLQISELADVKTNYTLPQSIKAPVKKGQIVGEISIFLGNNLLFSKNIITMEDVRSNTVWQSIKDVLSDW